MGAAWLRRRRLRATARVEASRPLAAGLVAEAGLGEHSRLA